MPTLPLIIAHRGLSSTEPENTLRAFAGAQTVGADGIELDCQLTRDKKVVVTHDPNTQRITGEGLDVCRSRYQDLVKLDFGKGEKIPLLAEVLDHFRKQFQVINIEIKSTGLFSNGIEAELVGLMNSFHCQDQVVISSFNPFNLLRVRRLDPRIRLGYLMGTKQTILARNRYAIHLVRPTTLNLDHDLLTRGGAHFFNMPLPQWIWTVNSVADLDIWLARGAQAIITDRPAEMRARVVQKTMR